MIKKPPIAWIGKSLMKSLRILLFSTLVSFTYSNALAADNLDESDTSGIPDKQYVVSLGIGGMLKPRYPGADSYLLSPFPIIAIGRFYVPGIGQVVEGNEEKRGIGFFPSFSFNGKREASDSINLTGTKSIDWAFEAGLGVHYRQDWFRGFAQVRQGFNGHTGQIGKVGFDFIAKPIDRIELVFGPRLDWGSNGYSDSYFGVTAAEAAAPGSRLAAYDPDGGIISVGLAAGVEYAFSEKTTFHLRARWDRYVGDAADSPIIKAGSEDQFSVGFGVSYRFDFDLFR
jgi:outer membrane protein